MREHRFEMSNLCADAIWIANPSLIAFSQMLRSLKTSEAACPNGVIVYLLSTQQEGNCGEVNWARLPGDNLT